MKDELEGPVTPLTESIASRLERVAAGEPLAVVLADADPEAAACVRLAVELGHLLPQEPRAVFRAALQVRLQTTEPARRRGWYVPRLSENPRRGRMLPRLAGSLLALVLVFASAVAASADALPGDALYGVKRVSEEARGLLIMDPEARMRFRLDLADERLREIETLIVRGSPVGQELLDAVAAQQQLAVDAGGSSSAAMEAALSNWSTSRGALLQEWARDEQSELAAALRRVAALLAGGEDGSGRSAAPGSTPAAGSPVVATLRTPALGTASAAYTATPWTGPTMTAPSWSPTPTLAGSSPTPRPLSTATAPVTVPTEASTSAPPVVELTPGSGGPSEIGPPRATELARRTEEARPTPDDGSSSDGGGATPVPPALPTTGG
jgi:hypothetical protein